MPNDGLAVVDYLTKRVPPFSEDAEKGVIGSIFLDKKFMLKCHKRELAPEDFYIHRYRTIYEVALELAVKKQPTDIITVSNRLKDLGQLDSVGGVIAIDDIVDHTPTAAHGEYYLDIVLDKGKAREVIESCRKIEQNAFNGDITVSDLLSEAKFDFHKIGFIKKDSRGVLQRVADLRKKYEDATETGSIGIKSRWFDYQQNIIGYFEGKTAVIAGETGQGKTTMGLNEILHKALEGIPVLIVSIEMGIDELLERLIADLMGINMKQFKKGYGNKDEHDLFELGGQIIAEIPLYFEHGNFTIEQICSIVREHKEEHNIQMAMIDYLQIISSTSGTKFANRNLEIAHMSQSILHLGNDTLVDNVLISQVTRFNNGYKDAPKEPELRHLRDSGSIEQDAYMVTFIFKDPDISGEWDDNQPTIFKVAKHRGGPLSRTGMTFNKSRTRFVGKDDKHLDYRQYLHWINKKAAPTVVDIVEDEEDEEAPF